MHSPNRFTWALSLITAFPLCAQTPQLQKPQTPAQSPTTDAATPASGDKITTLSVQARLVVVPAVVHDKKGAIIGDLTKDNFALTVDGKPQTVRYFDKDTDLPLTVGLLIDTSRSQTSVLDDERKGSAAFIEKLLAPAAGTRVADKAFVIQFAHSAELLQDVTDSRPKLEEALKDVDQSTDKPSFSNSGNSGDSSDNSSGNNDRHGRDQSGQSGGTVLYDAVYLASDEIESKQTNRRALVLLTDGDDRNSKENLARSIEAAQRADTVIYAIYYKGEEHGGGGYGGDHGGGYGSGGRHGGGFPGGGGGGNGGGGRGGGDRVDGKKVLERMCIETGGRMFEVSKKNTLDVIYAQIGDELRQGYRLGFTPSAEAREEGYHRIDLELAGAPAKNKLTVQTRDGYYTAGK